MDRSIWARASTFFFAISGYVIGRSLLPRIDLARSQKAPWREIAAIWTKRVFRLWPTALLWLAIVLAATAIWRFKSPSLGFDVNVDATVAGALNFANFRLADSFGVYEYGASFHFWTLSLEEQFYVLLPIIALLCRRTSVLACALIALIAIDLLRPFSMIMVMTRASALLLGVLIAIWSFSRLHGAISAVIGRISGWLLFAAMISSVMLVWWVAALPGNTTIYHGCVAAASALCVLFASFNRDALLQPRLWNGFMMWAGSRSYALYVIHVPLLTVMSDVLTPHFLSVDGSILLLFQIAFVTSSLLVTFGLADLNFRFIETPLRRVGVRIAARISGEQSRAAPTQSA